MADDSKEKDKPTIADNSLYPLVSNHLATQTIYLENLLTRDLTSSGSFDIRGEIWKTTLGKLLQSLPIPTMLVTDRYIVVAANEASKKIPSIPKTDSEFPLPSIFPYTSEAKKIISVVKKVFVTRKPLIAEAILGSIKEQIWSRMTFRSIRIGTERFCLIIIEDLTAEKKTVLLKEQEDRELRRLMDELEKRVEERTAELSKSNEARRILADAVQKLRVDERNIAIRNLRILVRPLLDKLKSEPPPSDVRSIVNALDIALQAVFRAYRSDVAKVFPSLTPKEMAVAELLACGLSTQQIGAITGVEAESVNSHRYNIRKKLGATEIEEQLSIWLKKKLENYPFQNGE